MKRNRCSQRGAIWSNKNIDVPILIYQMAVLCPWLQYVSTNMMCLIGLGLLPQASTMDPRATAPQHGPMRESIGVRRESNPGKSGQILGDAFPAKNILTLSGGSRISTEDHLMFAFLFYFLDFFCFSWLLASGFCGFWLLWHLAFVASVASVAFGFRGFRGFCGFWLFGLSIYLSISIYLSFFLFGSCSPFSFCTFLLFALQRRNQTRKKASKEASERELLTFGSGVLLGGRCTLPQPPPRHEICTSSPTPAPATKSIF